MLGDDADGKVLGVVGYDYIGRRVAEIARCFGMRVMVYDSATNINKSEEEEIVHVSTFDELLKYVDALTLHVPASNDGYVIGMREMGIMKKDVIIVNIARGGLLDEKVLLVALDNGMLASAGLDLLEQEPPLHPDLLLRSDKVIITPHNVALTQTTMKRMVLASMKNIIDFLAGGLIGNCWLIKWPPIPEFDIWDYCRAIKNMVAR